MALTRIGHTEVEPLRVPPGVHVVLHQQVVLRGGHFLSEVKISTFETRLKNQCAVLGTLQLIYLCRSVQVCGRLAESELHLGRALRAPVLAEQLALLKKCLDVEIVLVLESFVLPRAARVLINDSGIAGVNYI